MQPDAMESKGGAALIEGIDGPMERIAKLGIRSASPIDLLAVSISRSLKDVLDNESVSREMLKGQGINRIGNLSPADIHEITRLTEFETMRLLACLELGRRAGVSAKGLSQTVTQPADVAKMFDYLKDERKEHFCALFLNSKKGVIAIRTIHIGTVNMSIVGPREVFREAIREGATSLIVVHNHPSGDPTPSTEDIQVTVKLLEIGEMLDIPLDDHVIIGHNRYVSFRAKRLI